MKKYTPSTSLALITKKMIFTAVMFGVIAPAFALTQITSQLDPGETSEDVRTEEHCVGGDCRSCCSPYD